MILYFLDRGLNVLGLAGTDIDYGYHVTNDKREEDVESNVATFSFSLVFEDDMESDARELVKASNYVLCLNRKDEVTSSTPKSDLPFECYTILYNELDRASETIDVYAEDAGLTMINSIAPAYSPYSAFDKALTSKGLAKFESLKQAGQSWEIATYNTGKDSVIDADTLASKVYGDHGEAANAVNWYIHVAFANKDGNGNIIDFSLTDSDNRQYFGNYRDINPGASSDPSKYSWSKAEGSVNGGSKFKLHIAYADKSSSGNVYNFSNQTSANDSRGYVGGALVEYVTYGGSSGGSTSSSINVGDTVRIKDGAIDMNYHCRFASWVYQRPYTVIEARGNRIVFGFSNGAITGVTDAGHIIKNGGSSSSPAAPAVTKSDAPTDPNKYSWASVSKSNEKYAIGISDHYLWTPEKVDYFRGEADKSKNINSGHSLSNYYTMYVRGYFYFDSPQSSKIRFMSDDGGTLYINGVAIQKNDQYCHLDSKDGISLQKVYFNEGWNIVEMVIHQETGPNWFFFVTDKPYDHVFKGATKQNSYCDYLDPHTIEWYFSKFAKDTKFKIGTNEMGNSALTLGWDSEESVTKRLLSLANSFDCEMSYTCDVKNLNSVPFFYVNFIKKRGTDTGLELRFGKELSNIRIKSSVENLATALRVTGSEIEDDHHALTLDGYTYDDGNIFIDSDGTLKSREAQKLYGDVNGAGYITKTFSCNTTDQAELFKQAYNKLVEISKPEYNYEVDIQIPPESIRIGDRIRIIDEKGGIYLNARVVKLVRSIVSDNLTITLGDYLIEESKISKDLKLLAQQFDQYVKTAKTYTWFAYADDPIGTNISIYPYDSETDDLTGVTTYTHFRKYVGIAYGMFSPSVALTNPNLFQWSLVRGEDGIPGSKGADGKTYYFHVAYANKNSDGSIVDFSTTNSDGRSYIGTYSDEYQADATAPGAYKWQLVKGKDGESSIAHMAYANKDSNGNIVDFSTTENANRKWLGIYADYNHDASTDPTAYAWSKIVGDDGHSPVVSVSKSGGTATITVDGEEQAEIKDGKGIKSTAVTYQAAPTQTVIPTGTWSGSVPSLSESNPYLWTRTVITYTDNTTSTSYSVSSAITDPRINSTIIKHEQEYYLSTSDTSLAGGSWSTTFPTRKDGTFYWVRYKDTHANKAVTYDPSENGKLLTEVNEVWDSVVSNQTAINSSNAQINMVATSVTSVKNNLEKKADTDDVNSSISKLSGTVIDIGKQIADLKVKANSIEASVTEVNNLAQTTQKATAALTANGLSVDTGQITKSVVDGTGLTITSKADNSVVAKFTTGESEIQNLKIDGFMKIGAHAVQKMQDTEWDGTTVNGTGWMWNGG